VEEEEEEEEEKERVVESAFVGCLGGYGMCEMRRKAGILNCLICSGIFAGFALYTRMSPLSYTYSVECLLSTVLVGLSFRFIIPLVADGRFLNSCIRLCPGCSGWRRHRLRSGIRSSRSGLRRFL